MNKQSAPKPQSAASKTATRTTLLGVQLRRLRERRGWSQGQLAEASGVEKSTISRLESGLQRTAHDANLAALARVLQVPAALLKEAGQRPDTPPPVELLPFLQEALSTEGEASDLVAVLREQILSSDWMRQRTIAPRLAEWVKSREEQAQDELRQAQSRAELVEREKERVISLLEEVSGQASEQELQDTIRGSLNWLGAAPTSRSVSESIESTMDHSRDEQHSKS